MKINFFGSNYYHKKINKTPNTPPESHLQQTEVSAKMDTITISNSASHSSFSGLVRQIAQETISHDTPERIEILRQAVSEGSYSVSAEKVADAILDRIDIE